jgi:hypothetical protein
MPNSAHPRIIIQKKLVVIVQTHFCGSTNNMSNPRHIYLFILKI